MEILVTGGSGFLGGAMLPKLVQDTRCKKIFLLLRASLRQTPEKRRNEIIKVIFRPEDRALASEKIQVISGDLILPDMGLSPQDQLQLKNTITHILHVGASTDFGSPLLESREINVEGTRKLLLLAQECREHGHLERFDYVSTAFVAGTKRGSVSEFDLTRNQTFANAYEQSKYEAEVLVRQFSQKIPTVIYRPSIVVGDSRNGFTPHFKVLYWPLQLLSKNILPFIPCRRSATLDIVPVDFVAEGMYRSLFSEEALGRTIYLASGPSKSVRIDQFLRDAFQLTSIQRRPLIPMWIFKVMRGSFLKRLMSEEFWRICELAAVYNDYISGTHVSFDNRESEVFLNRIGCETAPPWEQYGKPVLKFCTESKWGRLLSKPEYEYRNPSTAS